MTEPAKRLLSILGLLPDGIGAADLDDLFPYDGRSSADGLASTGLALEEQKRWRLMPPVREFAYVQLKPNSEDLERCSAHFIEVAGIGQRIAWGNAGDRTIDEMARLKTEASNIEATIARKLKSPRFEEEGVRAALAFGRFQRFSGIGTSETLELALKAASDAGDVQLQAECHRVLGSMMRLRSQSEEARNHYKKAYRLYKQLADAPNAILGQAHCCRAFADLALVHGQHPRARHFYDRALPLYEKARHQVAPSSPQCDDARRGYANCIQRLGDVDHLSKRRDDAEASLSTAEKRYKEALAIYQEIQDWIGVGDCYKGFADVAVARRDLPTGRSKYGDARKKYLASGYKFGFANCSYSLGDVELLDNDLLKAEEYYSGARAVYQQIQATHGVANCLYSLGDVTLAMRKSNDAWRFYQDALQVYLRIGSTVGPANSYRGLGDVMAALGKGGASDHYKDAMIYARMAFGQENGDDPAFSFCFPFAKPEFHRWRR